MKFKVSIGLKIGVGFGVLLISAAAMFLVAYDTLEKSRRINDAINNIHNPSVAELEKFKLLIVRSKMLIYYWVNIEHEKTSEKEALIELLKTSIPLQIERLTELSKHWPDNYRSKLQQAFVHYLGLQKMQIEIMSSLAETVHYQEQNKTATADVRINQDGDLYLAFNESLKQIDQLITGQNSLRAGVLEKRQKSFEHLQFLVRNIGGLFVLVGILIAIHTTRTIVKPVQKLKSILLDLSQGVFPIRKIRERSDEIGEMINALNKLIAGLESTKNFANEIGSGNYYSDYVPLSNDDSLGYALLMMRDDLETNERILEQKVAERTAEVVKQKEEIELQNNKINEIYGKMTASIRYAKTIQDSILPSEQQIQKNLPDSFVLYQPKDIVSGDFYWVEKKNGKTYFAAVDCTGHGVPGGFMSIVGHNHLNTAFTSSEDPATILDHLNQSISRSVQLNSQYLNSSAGMDLALCSIDFNDRVLHYAGAYNPLFIVRDGELIENRADKISIGSYKHRSQKKFTTYEHQLQKGDGVYIFSDGYADQFGGVYGKKFMLRKFRQLLIDLHVRPPHEQKQQLVNHLQQWQGDHDQVDDILVIGVKIN